MAKNVLKKILAKGETDRLEFKSSFNADVIVALNAFANSSGGAVCVGVSDKKKVIGVELGTETIQTWVNEIKHKTEPAIIPDVETIEQDGKTVVVLSVKEFPVKPVAVQGRYYRRIANANHRMSATEIADQHLKTVNLSWDYYTDPSPSFESISMKKVSALIKGIQRNTGRKTESDPMRFLQKTELVRDGQLSRAARLLFAKEISPWTGIQVGRFKSPTKIIDSLTAQTDLISEVELVLGFLRKQYMTEYIITGNAQREERFDYPEDAVREIVLNMIVHRDYRDSGDSIIKMYDDRIEFFNPGRLTDDLTVAQLLADTYSPKARNTLINLMFKETGLVEKYGSGIKRIVDGCKAHGSRVTFENIQHGFMVVVYKTASNDGVIGAKAEKSSPKSSPKTEDRILAILVAKADMTTEDIAQEIGISKRAILKQIEKLKASGKLCRIGPANGGHWEIVGKG